METWHLKFEAFKQKNAICIQNKAKKEKKWTNWKGNFARLQKC